MKHFKWLLALLLMTGLASLLMADWVDVSEQFSIVESEPSATVPITVYVTVTNISGNPIEGEIRLIYVPGEGAAVPANALIAGEDGSDQTYYFPIVGGLEGAIDTEESIIITMIFDNTVTELPTYTLAVEVNDASVDRDIFRKKISKTPEFFSGEGAIAVMPVYVTARNTKGEYYTASDTGELVLCGESICDENGENCEIVACGEDDYARVKPIIVTYMQEEERATFNSVPDYDPDGDGVPDGLRHAHDVYAAVSLDDGLTWKRRNISRTSLKSSMTLDNGVAYPGDSSDQDLNVVGPYAFVTWTDKYCRSGDPWGLEESGMEDEYQVTGSQKSVDYLDVHGDEVPRPDLGTRPFSCVWAARGVLDQTETLDDGELNPNFGTVVWYKAEQLSTGRRDAKRNFNAGIEPIYDPTVNNPTDGTGGFAVTWQEDPKGLKTGKGRGPGAGMSGACVNHKTDIWYSFIPWDTFATVDADFVPNSSGDAIADGDGDPMSEYFCTQCPYVYDPEIGDEANGIAPGTAFADLPFDPTGAGPSWSCPICGAAKDTFEKDAKPHAEHHFSAPVRVTNNAVCRQRTATEVWGHIHDPAVTDCDYYYEGGTNSQPLAWDDLPGDWACPKCGLTKQDSFLTGTVFIKNRNEGAPYCEDYAANKRVDGDGNVIGPDDSGYDIAYYTKDGVPLDGNTGASRANLSLVNWYGETLALIAYEETKGVGTGSDKEAAAMEQSAPLPLVQMSDGTWEAGFTNSDCRSCHYQNVVPRDRVIPMATEQDCAAKGGAWLPDEITAYFPYEGYALITEAPVAELPEGVSTINPASGTERPTPCVKFFGGWGMYPRDYARIHPGDNYYNLPDHMPGWHQEALDCTGCHLPYNTKDLDGDDVPDRGDKCPDTVLDEPSTLDTDPASPRYGCIEAQEPVDPNDPDNNKDEPDRFRHGKNVYYHHFEFSTPDAIAHGEQINGYSRDVVAQDEAGNNIVWIAPGNYDPYENARRVRVVPNAVINETDSDAVTLGLLYKEGKDGQGSPADAILRLFRGGFGVENMEAPLNMSSSTPYLFQDPDTAGSEDGSGDNPAGDGTGDMVPNRNTPKIDYYYWTDENLYDPTGYWMETDGAKDFGDDGYTPELSANPFENVFSTRLAIHGNTILAGYAYCVNWSAGKKAKDHYDFYIRASTDAGTIWTLPVNVSQLKNHEISVSDCRVQLTPPSLDLWNVNGAGIPFSQTGAPAVENSGDFNIANRFFVGVGTKENIPQPSPNVLELEESEVFLDTFYARADFMTDELVFETYQKENPKYEVGADPFIAPDGTTTSDEFTMDGSATIPNQPNPAYPEFVDEFNWLAKGDAHQGDIQMTANPMGSRLYTIWEQELAITDDDGQKHFQGADVWFRKVFYDEPEADLDVNQDGEIDWTDGREILRNIGKTAYDQDFLWTGDFLADHRITGKDFNLWKREYFKQNLKNLRKRWTAN